MALSDKRSKLYARTLVILTVAFIAAGAGTKITYPCSPSIVPAGESVNNCISFEKAIMHPSDFIVNKQDTLLHFVSIFVLVSLLLLALTIVITKYRHKR